MGRAILVTGGARSGKSSLAEKLAKELEGDILYIATAIPFDEEMKHRVKKHQESRPEEWRTYEGYQRLGDVIMREGSRYKGILLDCITVMLTNIFLEFPDIDYENPKFKDFERVEEEIGKEVENLIEGIGKTNATVIMVTNELGSGVVPENVLARVFRDIAGRVNQTIAQASDEVYLTVCGLPVKVK